MNCLYYERVQTPIARNAVRGYCLGCPAVELMVPSLMEERDYCLKDGDYLECPVYRAKLTWEPDIDSEEGGHRLQAALEGVGSHSCQLRNED